MKKVKVSGYDIIVEPKDESGYFVGIVPALPGCYTQAKSLPKLYKRLEEVIVLCQRNVGG